MPAFQPGGWLRSRWMPESIRREPIVPTGRPSCMRAVLLVTVIGIVAAGCSLGSSGSSSVVPTGESVAMTQLAHYRGHDIAFDYPAAWGRYRRSGFFTTMTSPIVDLSTQPMVDPCMTSGGTTRCGLPVHHMRPGGVVVVWWAGGGFTSRMLHLRRAVRIKVVRDGCRDIGGNEIITAQVAARHHQVFLASACLRGPGIAANERAFRAMARSAVSID
jgi:hypothetical protein